MERSATAAATGNSLTLQAGGTKSGNTDQNGGDLVLSSGTSTGTGSSNITFKTAPAGATGTADRAPATAMTILGNGNVGIGTTTPNALLTVNGGSYNTSINIIGSNSNAVGLDIKNTSAGGHEWIVASTGAAGAGGAGNLLIYDLTGAGKTIITSSVGIGGSFVPIQALHVRGNQRLDSGGTGNQTFIDFSDGTATQWYLASRNALDAPNNRFSIFNSVPTEIMTILQGGNVGIGTTSPTNLLSLGGDAARTIWMERSATAAATGNSLTLQAGGTKSGNTDQNGGDLVLSSGTATGTGSSNITFKTAPAGTTGTTDRSPATAMTILGNGNVGIGTNSPAAQIDIYNPALDTEIDSIKFKYANSYHNKIQNILSAYDANQRIQFTLTNNNTTKTPLALLANGNVGVSIKNPAVRLAVAGTDASQVVGTEEVMQLMRPNLSTSVYDQIVAFKVGAWAVSAPSPFTRFDINLKSLANGTHSADVNVMTMLSNGNVGIGTTTPNQGKLEVKGGTVCVDTDSDDNATSCITTESDARLKKNVQALDVSLDTFMKLRPVSFDWKHDDPEVLKHYSLINRFADHPHSIGMIAQEVQAIVPEAILPETVGDADVQYLQLDYTKLVPVVIKAVQDLKHVFDKQNERLSAEVEALKSENADLKKRLKVLESIILIPEARAATETPK